MGSFASINMPWSGLRSFSAYIGDAPGKALATGTTKQGTINFLGNGSIAGTCLSTDNRKQNNTGTKTQDITGTFNSTTGKIEVKTKNQEGKLVNSYCGTLAWDGYGSTIVHLAVFDSKGVASKSA